MKVRIDRDRCMGHGRCYATAPELFVPDDLGNGVEVGDGTVPAGLEEQARLAVANCPEQAITIEDHDTAGTEGTGTSSEGGGR